MGRNSLVRRGHTPSRLRSSHRRRDHHRRRLENIAEGYHSLSLLKMNHPECQEGSISAGSLPVGEHRSNVHPQHLEIDQKRPPIVIYLRTNMLAESCHIHLLEKLIQHR